MTKRDGGTYYWSTRDRLSALLLALPMRSAGKPNAVIFGTRNNDCHNRQVNTPVKLQPNSLRPSIQMSSMSSAGPFTPYISTSSDLRIITLCISRPSLTYTTILTLTRSPTSIGTLRIHGSPNSGIWKREFFHSMDHWHSNRYHSCDIYPYHVLHRHEAESPPRS